MQVEANDCPPIVLSRAVTPKCQRLGEATTLDINPMQWYAVVRIVTPMSSSYPCNTYGSLCGPQDGLDFMLTCSLVGGASH